MCSAGRARLRRLLAVGRGLVSPVRHVRCPRVFVQHSAHVLHKRRPLHGHPQSIANGAQFNETVDVHQDHDRVAVGHDGLQFDHNFG